MCDRATRAENALVDQGRRLAALEAENARLRERLESIAAFLRRETEYYGRLWDPVAEVWRFDATTVASGMSTLGIAETIARDALGEVMDPAREALERTDAWHLERRREEVGDA